jgi:hypothetical protein
MNTNNSKTDQKTICKFYLNSHCKFGDGCKHYHPKNKMDELK